MNYLFVPFEIAFLAKENGFDEECFGTYEHNRLDKEQQVRFHLQKKWDFHTAKKLIELAEKNGRPGMIFGEGEIKNSKLSQWLYAAPLYDQLINWFKENHRIKIRETPFTSGKDEWVIWKWNTGQVCWERIFVEGSANDKDVILEEAFKLI